MATINRSVFAGGFVKVLQDIAGRPTPTLPMIQRHVTGQVLSSSGLAITQQGDELYPLALGSAFQGFAENGKYFLEALDRAEANAHVFLPAQLRGTSGMGNRQPGYVFKLTDDDAAAYCVDKSFVHIEDRGTLLNEVSGVVALYEDAYMQLLVNNGRATVQLPVGDSKKMDIGTWEESAAQVRANGPVWHKNVVRSTGEIIESWGFPRGDQRATDLNSRVNEEALANSVLSKVAAPVITPANNPRQNNNRRSVFIGSIAR